jgi:mRNA-degrading endonuclease toxin of MazEF toxin-antitoxin module
MATVCPVTARPPKYVGEVPIPSGHAGQTLDGLILCHQARTVDLVRLTAFEVGGRAQFVTDPAVRAAVRLSLGHQLGLDVASASDGALD